MQPERGARKGTASFHQHHGTHPVPGDMRGSERGTSGKVSSLLKIEQQEEPVSALLGISHLDVMPGTAAVTCYQPEDEASTGTAEDKKNQNHC